MSRDVIIAITMSTNTLPTRHVILDSEVIGNPIAVGERSTVPGLSTARVRLFMHGYAIRGIDVMDPRWTWTVPFTFCAR